MPKQVQASKPLTTEQIDQIVAKVDAEIKALITKATANAPGLTIGHVLKPAYAYVYTAQIVEHSGATRPLAKPAPAAPAPADTEPANE